MASLESRVKALEDSATNQKVAAHDYQDLKKEITAVASDHTALKGELIGLVASFTLINLSLPSLFNLEKLLESKLRIGHNEWGLISRIPASPVGTGARGPTGPQGRQGADGRRGSRGERGAAGPRGPRGARGPDGRAGARGAQGPDGRLPSTAELERMTRAAETATSSLEGAIRRANSLGSTLGG